MEKVGLIIKIQVLYLLATKQWKCDGHHSTGEYVSYPIAFQNKVFYIGLIDYDGSVYLGYTRSSSNCAGFRINAQGGYNTSTNLYAVGV